MTSCKSSICDDRVTLTIIKRSRLEPGAIRAFLKAVYLLGLAFGLRLSHMQKSGETRHARHEAELAELRLQLRAAQQTNELLQRRLDKITPRQRPHYAPESRFKILSLKHLFQESQEEIAR